MISSKIFESKLARTTFYIIFVGGLFLLFSVFFATFCNEFLSNYFRVPELSLLEAGGLFAIFHIIYSGIKFGYNKMGASLSDEDMSILQNNDNLSDDEHHIDIDTLSRTEKNRLKEEIAKCCGMKKEQKNLISKTQRT